MRAIAQATDGSLWIGTDEGLARFDGTEFTVFRKGDAGLPSGSITALASSRDGSMWIGTLAGVSHYQRGMFRNLDWRSGLGTETVSALLEARDGTVWAAGGRVVSARDERIANYGGAQGVPPDGLRELLETEQGVLWAAGIGTAVTFAGDRFHAVTTTPMAGNIALAMTAGRDGVVWIAGTRGIALVRPDVRSRLYGVKRWRSYRLKEC